MLSKNEYKNFERRGNFLGALQNLNYDFLSNKNSSIYVSFVDIIFFFFFFEHRIYLLITYYKHNAHKCDKFEY